MRSVKSVLLVALVAGACSNAVSPTNLVGKWAEDFSIPGNFFEMNLTLNGSSISGGGQWCGEAGPCGTVAVTGTVSGSDVHLDLVSTAQIPTVGSPTTSHFDGRLTSATTLRGSITSETSGAQPRVISYHRE